MDAVVHYLETTLLAVSINKHETT